MKKGLRMLLALGGLCLVLTGGAMAADYDGTVVDNGDGSYTASCSITQQGKQYAILVVKNLMPDWGFRAEDVLFIDQKAADENGVSFTYIPKSYADCAVLLGGEFADGVSPKMLGEVEGKGATIDIPMGNIGYEGVTPPTVALSGTSGDYSFEDSENGYTASGIMDGEYTLTISKTSHLPYTVTVTVQDGEIVGGIPQVELLAGDVDDDHRYINTGDISALLVDFKREDAVGNPTNVNEDGYVNISDLSIILSNFKKSYEN